MKQIFLGILISVAAYFGYQAWLKQNTPPLPATVITAATPSPTPEPIVIAATPEPEIFTEPTPPPRNLAPEGVFFLVKRASIPTDSGIIAFVPGTKVKAIKVEATKMTVTDGNHEFDVSPTQVTNDLDIARQVADIYNSSVAKTSAAAQEQLIEIERQKQEALLRSSQQTTGNSQSIQAKPRTYLNPLTLPPRTTIPNSKRPRDKYGNFTDGYDNNGYKIQN